MSWLDAVPVALAAAGWLVGPGLALAYAVGLRGISALGMAPVFSVLLVSVTAVVGQKAGQTWSVWLVLGVTAVTVVLAVVASLLLRRIAPPRESDPPRTLLVAAAALVPAMAVAWFVVVRGFGQPDELSQTFDAMFHYSAVSYILESGSASSLTINSLGNPSTAAGFYPAGWHGVTSLVVLTTGTDIATATNMVSWAIAGLIWPIGSSLLVRQVVGRNTAAMAITPILSVAFTAFPWGLLSFGVLWPNALSLALVPSGLAAVLAATKTAKDDTIGFRRAITLAPLVLVACAFAHPNAVFSLAVLAVFPFGTAVLRYALKTWREGQAWRGVVAVLGTLAVLFGLWWFVAHAEAFRQVRQMYWPPFETPANAVGEALLNATNGRPALWALSVLTVAGLVVAWRLVNHRWLIAAAAASTFLYVLTAAINRPDTQKFTGYWYNDSFRLAAMLPITAVPLVVLAVLLIAGKVAGLFPAGSSRLALLRTPTALALLVVVVLLPLTGGFYAKTNAAALAGTYTKSDPKAGTLVDDTEEAFLPKLAAAVPKDAVVANNPWDGSAVMLAEVRRKALYPHADIAWSAEQEYLSKNLDNAANDPRVCAAAQKVGVRYLLLGNKTFWPNDQRQQWYTGIAEPKSPGAFELVAQEGPVKLYRLDRCGSTTLP